jgi:hypothetical protein
MLLRPGYPALLTLLAFIGLSSAGMALFVNASIAERIPDAARGRVFALTGAVYESAELCSALTLTAIGGAIGSARGMAIGGAVAACLSAVLVARRLRTIRASDAERAVLSSARAPVHDSE